MGQKRKEYPKLVIDPDDAAASVMAMYPDEVVSFHLKGTPQGGIDQVCVSNRKWHDCAIVCEGPEQLPDGFSVKGEVVQAVRLVGIGNWRLNSEVNPAFVNWADLNMLIYPGCQMPMFGQHRGKREFDKNDTWAYLTAFFTTKPMILYIHVWPSEIKKWVQMKNVKLVESLRARGVKVTT